MKKKIFSIIGVLILLFSLTGCIKFNATMEIREDKSMDFSIIYAMNKSILEMSDEPQELIDENGKKELIDKGFVVEDYEDNDNKGFILTKKIANIDEYSSENDVEYSISGIFEESSTDKIFKVIKGNDKNKYIANFKFDSNDNTLNDASNNDNISEDVPNDVENDENLGDLSKMGEAMTSTMDLKFVVKLPYKPINDNATEKSEDGKTLTWKLNTNQTDNIKFEFELNNSKNNITDINSSNNKVNLFKDINITTIIGVIVLIIGIIVLVVALIIRNKNNKNKKKILEY